MALYLRNRRRRRGSHPLRAAGCVEDAGGAAVLDDDAAAARSCGGGGDGDGGGDDDVYLCCGPLPGQDKYLGIVVGEDGCLYGIPGSARRVLKITPGATPGARPTGEPIGPTLNGSFVGNALKKSQFKWLRGVPAAAPELAGESVAIYGIPANADAVLKVVPQTGAVTTLKSWRHPVTGATVDNPLLPGRWKWHGAAKARDGNIYGSPCNSDHVLMIVPRTGEVRLVPLPEPADQWRGRSQKWYGAIVGSDGAVYCIPYCGTSVLRIQPGAAMSAAEIEAARMAGMPPPPSPHLSFLGNVPSGGWKWHGGVAAPDGCIYGTPSHARRVLRVTPGEEGLVETIGDEDIVPTPVFEQGHRRWKAGTFKYGGAVVGPDGDVFCLPYDAQHVLRVTPARRCRPSPSASASASGGDATYPATYPATVEEGEREGEGRGGATVSIMACDPASSSAADFRCHNKWQNGFVGRDGRVYAIPVSAPAVLRIDPITGVVDTIGRELCGPGSEKWEGGAVHPDGGLYCIPQDAKQVLVINPGPRQEEGGVKGK